MTGTKAPVVTLTTDFGAGSAYVAELKGVLLSAVPQARLVDVSHDLPPFDLVAAEVLLRRTAFAFPLGTTHIVVIDPGVGGERRPLAVRSRGNTFVGPDNGVLGVALAQPDAVAVVLDRPEFHRRCRSSTFHGRDIFAPVAGVLAAGLKLADVGTPIADALRSRLPVRSRDQDRLRGTILASDRFGNLTTNLPGDEVCRQESLRVESQAFKWVDTYVEITDNRPTALIGSDGYIELAVREGSARDWFVAEMCDPLSGSLVVSAAASQ